MADTPTHRVLIVEDERVSREALVELLGLEGYDVRSAQGGDDALDELSDWAPDLVLSDISMPRGHGFALVAALREREDCRDTAILMVSARDDLRRRIRALDIGADDFVAKPVDPEELLARIRAHLRSCDRRREIDHDSRTDAVTGLYNRRGLQEAIDREIARARRGSCFSLLLFELDDFGRLADLHGRSVGDEILRHAARGLRSAARTLDHLGRHERGEFVAVLSGCDGVQATAALQRFRSGIERPFLTQTGEPIALRASIGAATYKHAQDPQSLLREASRAMGVDRRDHNSCLAALRGRPHSFSGPPS